VKSSGSLARNALYSMWSLSRALRPLKKMGSGNSPRSLSPLTGIWRPASPVEGCWLSVSRRYVGLHERCNPFRPRSGTGLRCHHRGHSGETSQLGSHTPAGVLIPNPVRMPLRIAASNPLPQGRHRCLSAPIVGLAPRVLSLIPQVAFSFSGGRPRFRDLPQFGSYYDSAVIAGLPAPSTRIAQSAMALFPFHAPAATPVRFSGSFCSFKTAGRGTTTLAHSSNYRSLVLIPLRRLDRLCSPQVPKPRIGGRDSVCGWFV